MLVFHSTSAAQTLLNAVSFLLDRQERSRSRTVGSAYPSSNAMQAVTVVKPALCIRTTPRLQSVSVATWGQLKFGRWVDTICCQCHTLRMRVIGSSCVIRVIVFVS
jgi:hypothetical protein